MALFALSLGMGAPLLVIGTSAGKILPRAGDWMNTIKAVFGVLLLAVAIWMLERIIPVAVSMGLWAALVMVSGIYMGAIEPLGKDATGWQKLWKGVGLILLVYGILMLVGVAAGGRDSLQPLQGVISNSGISFAGTNIDNTEASHRGLVFKQIKGLEQLDSEIAAASASGKAVMLDFYADWCISCKEMEKFTFSDRGVQAALAGVVLLQADVTPNDDLDKALLKRFGLFGPPSIMFFGPDGQERRPYRVVGFMNAEKFRAHVTKALM
jgi:thiol:disulfide interchange protein DsbD